MDCADALAQLFETTYKSLAPGTTGASKTIWFTLNTAATAEPAEPAETAAGVAPTFLRGSIPAPFVDPRPVDRGVESRLT
jgi:hypothetical protein